MDKHHDNREGGAASRSKEIGESGSPRGSRSPGESRGPGEFRSPGERGGRGIRAPRGSPPVASLLLAAVLAVASVASASAAEVDGVHFDDFVDLDGLRLNLNGAGLREVYIVKTWVAALYTPEPVHSPAALITGTGPRRIAVTLLADVSIDRVARGILDALRRNHDPILISAIEPSIREFVAVLRSIGATEKGDTLTLDMLRGTTRVSFNGMAVGEPVSGVLFRDALLRAFVGKQPIDDSLARSLLGQQPAPALPSSGE